MDDNNIHDVSPGVPAVAAVVDKNLDVVDVDDKEEDADEDALDDDPSEGQPACFLSQPQIKPLCEICRLETYKYTCPACLIKTCCLTCINAHKATTKCNGKRNRAEYAPMESMNTTTLLSDYALLEESARAAQRARRTASAMAASAPRPTLPPALHHLQKTAEKHGVDLCFMQPGMSRRKNNSTRVYNNSSGGGGGRRGGRGGGRGRGSGGRAGRAADASDSARIEWHVEWRFQDVKDTNGDVVVRVDNAVPENTTMLSALNAHVSSGTDDARVQGAAARAELKSYAGEKRNVRLLLEGLLDAPSADVHVATPGGPVLSSPVDETRTLRDALSGHRIVEHPVFFVSVERDTSPQE